MRKTEFTWALLLTYFKDLRSYALNKGVRVDLDYKFLALYRSQRTIL